MNADGLNKKKLMRREWLEAACIVSYLYDIAGRSEDAHHLRWENITERGDQGLVRIASGKTSAKRTGALTVRTMTLLSKLRSEEKKDGKVFRFDTVANLRVNTERKIKTV